MNRNLGPCVNKLQISVQLLMLKRQKNCCREDLEEEQNGVEGKCM